MTEAEESDAIAWHYRWYLYRFAGFIPINPYQQSNSATAGRYVQPSLVTGALPSVCPTGERDVSAMRQTCRRG